MSSYASTASTIGGNLYDQGASLLTEMGNKYKDNDLVTGFVTGAFQDAGNTMMQSGLALQYNTAMSSHLAKLNQGMENLKTGNQLKLMGAEGRIAKDLIGAQGAQQRLGIKETGAQQRLNIGAQGAQDRLNIAATGVEQRAGIRETGSEQRKGMRVKGSEDRKSLVTAGQQERLNIGERAKQQQYLRSDARGAIRSLGARFFG